MKQKHRLLTCLLVVALAIGMASCGKPAAANGSAQNSLDADFGARLAAEYAMEDAYEYLPAIPPVERDGKFVYELGFNPIDKGFEVFDEIIGVYADADFTLAIASNWDVDQKDHDNSVIAVGPGRSPALAIHNKIFTDDIIDDTLSDAPADEYYLDFKGEFADWGNLPRYYMVQWVDLNTGDPLEKPIVQVFEVKTELKAPEVEFFTDDQGKASFRWKPVDGAERYIVVETNANSETGMTGYETVAAVGMLDGNTTEWHAKNNLAFKVAENAAEVSGDSTGSTGTSSVTTGANPESADVTPGADPEAAAENPEENTDEVIARTSANLFGVVAIGNNGHSPIGKLFNAVDLAPNLPANIAYNARRDSGDNSNTVPAVGLLPAKIPVVMCDGHIIEKTIAYDYEGAKVVQETWAEYDEGPNGEMLNLRSNKVTILKIDWVLSGTDITGYYNVLDPPDNWKEELDKIKERQDSLNRGSGTGDTISIDDQRNEEEPPSTEGTPGNEQNPSTEEPPDNAPPSSDGEPSGNEKNTENVNVDQSKVFATNALSEYIAINLLAGKTTISLDGFNRASDTDLLLDAFFEAYYQNPLILGVDDLSLTAGGDLVVTYQDSAAARTEKQNAIREKVAEIVPEIIKNDMTPLEKELAINQYLCDNAEYDVAALEDAEKNNYRTVDASFNDSFTAYGILVDGVGVCASYAASFKLLADAADLESIVVTGMLEGSIAHAWNRTNIDGQWLSVDVTNNDNPYFFNALLNLPDDVAAGTLVEDKDFVLDAYLTKYVASDEDKEYYHTISKYYSASAVAAELVNALQMGDTVTLRTDYFIDDYDFAEIATDVIDLLNNDDLYGGYWLGVINLSKG